MIERQSGGQTPPPGGEPQDEPFGEQLDDANRDLRINEPIEEEPDEFAPPPRLRQPKGPQTDKIILARARELFARHGYDGTSIRAITTYAEVNLSAVRYYFNNKEQLYFVILRHIIGPLAPSIEQVSRLPFPPLERVDRIVRAFFNHIRANPDMPAFMVRELAEGKRPSPPIMETMGRALPALAGVIAEGQKDGTIRPGDPILLALSTVAQPVYLYLARGAIKAAAKIEMTEERVVEHVVTTVRAALEQR